MINRAKMPRQLRNKGGIMTIGGGGYTGIPMGSRTGFGIVSKLKDRVRKLIPNELANVASKAAPFVAPFNPAIAGLMRGIGRFDQRGSLSDAFKQGIGTFAGGQLLRTIGGAGPQRGFGTPGDRFTSPLSADRTTAVRDFFSPKEDTKFIEKVTGDAKKTEKGLKSIRDATGLFKDTPILKDLPSIVQQQILVGGASGALTYIYQAFLAEEPPQEEGETYDQYIARRRENVGRKMKGYFDNYFKFDKEYSSMTDEQKQAFIDRVNIANGGRIGFDVGGSVIGKVANFFFDEEGNASKALQRAKFEISKFISGMGTDLETGAEWYNKLEPEEQREIIEEKMKYREKGELGGVPVYDEKYAGKFGIGGNYADGGAIGIEVLFREKKNLGGLLTGQAKSIYDNMTAAGYFTEDEIRNAITTAGYEIPDAAPTPTPAPDAGIINQRLTPQRDDRVIGLQETFTKDLSGDPRFNYLEPTAQANKYRFDRSVEPRDGLMGFYDRTKNFFAENKFFQPKVRGTLGTRIANQPKLPLPGAIAAYSLSPFNPDSRNYNPLLEGQLNFLEGLEDMIGRDPGTGGLKYGSGSVLAGKNVISGFGSNNYEVALNKYLQRMNRYENPTKKQQEKIAQAQAELAAEKERQIREAKTKAEALKAIQSQGKMDYNPNIHGPVNYGKDSQGNQSFDSGQGFGIGSDGGPVSNRTGRGRQGYGEGGLASMFVEKK